jgi:hypothetical protein
METQQEIDQEIKYYLELSGHQHLATSLDIVPKANREALYNLISDLQYNRVQKQVISLQVSEDVAALVAGFPEQVKFSKEYLNEE